jgi:hypothetical protein
VTTRIVKRGAGREEGRGEEKGGGGGGEVTMAEGILVLEGGRMGLGEEEGLGERGAGRMGRTVSWREV